MPRRKRDLTAGTFHIYTHAVWAASALFRHDADRMMFVRELARATARVGWTCMAYCLLTTHYHLLVEVEAGVLSDGMHALNFRYASYFNNRYRMKGHVFAARYDSQRIRDEEHLLTVFRYIARNPAEAGLCRSAADWRWSSYPETIGRVEPSSFVDATEVLESFGGTDEFAAERLRRFVEDS
jgi:putative transposase